MKVYYQKNKVKRLAQIKEWTNKNPNYHKEYGKKWHSDPKHKPNKKNSQLKSLYGITLEQYNQMFVNQNGVCCICKQGTNDGSHLRVDHNHITGKVRGLLCSTCNTAIGMMKDDASLFLEAIKYLTK